MTREKILFNDLDRIHRPLYDRFVTSVREILESSNFVLGTAVEEFEKQYTKLEDSAFCIGVDNGTNAIELMLRSVGIKSGDEVITTALTFVATVFAIERIGAIPVLVDIENNSPLIDPDKIEEKVSSKTKALLIVSLHGRVANIEDYQALASKYGLHLLLDGAQSHLAKYRGKTLAHYFSAISTSFYPGKNLGSLGEGGAILTNNQLIAEKIRLYRDWGAATKYEHSNWGGNFRLHALQAKFLSLKLSGIEEWTEQRREIGRRYNTEIDPCLTRKALSEPDDHVFHIYEIGVPDRTKSSQLLNKFGISWGIHYPKTIAQTTSYRHLGITNFPNAEKFASQTISLPIFPLMTQEEQSRVIDVVAKIGKLT